MKKTQNVSQEKIYSIKQFSEFLPKHFDHLLNISFAADRTFQLKMYSILLCYFCSHGLVVLQVLREVLREKLVN